MTKFSTNCTLPPTVVNWVSSPDVRGTWDIFWAALSTLFLCTWSVQHPNLPSGNSIAVVKAKIARLLKRLALMLMTLMVPEFLLLKAIGDFESARALEKHMVWRANEDLATWSVVHSYFLNMGGFVMVFDENILDMSVEHGGRSRSGSNSSLHASSSKIAAPVVVEVQDEVDAIKPLPSPSSEVNLERGTTAQFAQPISNTEKYLDPATTCEDVRPKYAPTSPRILTFHQKNLRSLVVVREQHLPVSDQRNTTLVQGALELMKQSIQSGDYDNKSFVEVNKMAINLVRLRGSKWALDGAQFIYARDNGLIESVPNITQDEITDKSKTDSLAKFLACLTVFWQILQLLIRWAKQLPTSQLEVVVVAYSLLTLLIYAMNWNKPQDIQMPCLVPALRYPTMEQLMALAEVGPNYVAGAFPGFGYAIPEHALHSNFGKEDGAPSWLGGIAGGLVFGALHCAAWSFTFPTPVESLLWKIASLVTTCIPLFYVARTVLMSRLEKQNRQRWPIIEDTLIPGLGMVGTALYTFARLFLLVETFRSLLYLVPDTFQS